MNRRSLSHSFFTIAIASMILGALALDRLWRRFAEGLEADRSAIQRELDAHNAGSAFGGRE